MLKLLQIILHDQVFPHMCVHRRCNQLRAGTSQHGCRQHIISDAIGKLPDNIRCRRCDQNEIRLLRERNMLDLPGMITVKGVRQRLMMTERFKGVRRDEMLRVFRHDDIDRSAGLHQPTCDIRRLIRRDAACHSENDILSLQHRFFPSVSNFSQLFKKKLSILFDFSFISYKQINLPKSKKSTS